MGFEVYQKGSAPLPTVPTVTVQKRGLISLNRAAHGLIGDAEAVELLWDPERRVIGLRPATLANQNAYPVRVQNVGSNKGPMLVAANLFTQYIGLDTTVAKRWTPSVEDGILVIDLATPGVVATSNRSRSGPSAPEEGF